MERFALEKFLGKGSYGAVVLARRNADGQMYAIKQIGLQNLPKDDRDAQLTEIRVLSQIWHPNILRIYEAFIQNKKINMVLEYAPLGDLDREIQQHVQRHQFFEEKRVWEVLLQVLAALRALHNQGVLHRDVKGQNILCFAGGVVKIADFGVAKILKKGQLAHTGIGTPYFISPEVWQNAEYDAKCDVFSLGCLIYEMCELSFPFKGRDMQALGRAICKNQYQPVSDRYSRDLRTLITKMLEKNAQNRYSIQQLLDSEEVHRRTQLCPTTLEEQILPGLGTQRDIFNAGYSEQLGKTIQYDSKVRGALEDNYVYGQRDSNQTVLLGEQYDKISQMQRMTEYQQHRSKDNSNEVSSAFQAQLLQVDRQREQDAVRLPMIDVAKPQAQPQANQAVQVPLARQEQSKRYFPGNYQPVAVRQPPAVLAVKPTKQTVSSEPLRQPEDLRQKAPQYGALPPVYVGYPQQNPAPQRLGYAQQNRFQVMRPKPLEYAEANRQWQDPQKQYADYYRREVAHGYARRNESDFRNYYGV